LFLDDAFSGRNAVYRLEQAGYTIEPFARSFHTDIGKEESVKDPRVIRLCNSKGWLLVTSDSNMRFTHLDEIKNSPNLAILATAHNSAGNLDQWIEALIVAKPAIEREFKKRQRPWFGQFNRQGKITTIYTITEEHKPSRKRPSSA
jgi:hypothetical protein